MRPLKKTPRVVGIPINKTAAISLGRGVKDSLLKNKVNSEERNRRLKICHSCEHFSAPRCTLCGCFMNFKTTLASSQCPVGKWSLAMSELAIDHSGESETKE
jgi:hypothetical protein